MTPASRASQGQELTAATVAIVLAVFIGGGVVGFATMGIPGAFVGAIGAAMISVVVLGLRRVRESERSLEGVTPPNLDGLDSRQAMTVMTAIMGSGEAFRSELLAKLESAAATGRTNPERGLVEVEALRQQHPHNPAIHAEVARLQLALDREDAAASSVSEALRYALDGGMNPTAARLFEEFAGQRDRLVLSARHRAQLGRVLRTRGAIEAAQWCEKE